MTKADWSIAIEAAAIVADDYAKRTRGARRLPQEAEIAAEHIAKRIRDLKAGEVDTLKPSIIGAAGHEALYPMPPSIEAGGAGAGEADRGAPRSATRVR